MDYLRRLWIYLGFGLGIWLGIGSVVSGRALAAAGAPESMASPGSSVFFGVSDDEAVVTALMCYDAPARKLVLGDLCFHLVPAGARVRFWDGRTAELGKRATLACSEEYVESSGEIETPGNVEAVELTKISGSRREWRQLARWAIWPESAARLIEMPPRAAARRPEQQRKDLPLLRRMAARAMADGWDRAPLPTEEQEFKLSVASIHELDADGDRRPDLLYSGVCGAPDHKPTCLFLLRGRAPTKPIIVAYGEDIAYQFLGSIDLDGDGARELLVHWIREDGKTSQLLIGRVRRGAFESVRSGCIPYWTP